MKSFIIGAVMLSSAPAAAQVSPAINATAVVQQHNRCRDMQQRLIQTARQPGFIAGVSEAQVIAMSAPVVASCVGQETAIGEIEGEVARLRRLVRWQRTMSTPRHVEAVGSHAHVQGDAVVCDQGMLPVLDGSIHLGDRRQGTLYVTCADDGTRAQTALDALVALVQPRTGESLVDAVRRARREFLAQPPTSAPAPSPTPAPTTPPPETPEQREARITTLSTELGLPGIRDEIRALHTDVTTVTTTANAARDSLNDMHRRSGIDFGLGARVTAFGAAPSGYTSSSYVGEAVARLSGRLSSNLNWQVGGSAGYGDQQGQSAFQWSGLAGMTYWTGQRFALTGEAFVAGATSLGDRVAGRSSGFLGMWAGGQGGVVVAPSAALRLRLLIGGGYGRTETGTRQNPGDHMQGGIFTASAVVEYHLPW